MTTTDRTTAEEILNKITASDTQTANEIFNLIQQVYCVAKAVMETQTEQPASSPQKQTRAEYWKNFQDSHIDTNHKTNDIEELNGKLKGMEIFTNAFNDILRNCFVYQLRHGDSKDEIHLYKTQVNECVFIVGISDNLIEDKTAQDIREKDGEANMIRHIAQTQTLKLLNRAEELKAEMR